MPSQSTLLEAISSFSCLTTEDLANTLLTPHVRRLSVNVQSRHFPRIGALSAEDMDAFIDQTIELMGNPTLIGRAALIVVFTEAYRGQFSFGDFPWGWHWPEGMPVTNSALQSRMGARLKQMVVDAKGDAGFGELFELMGFKVFICTDSRSYITHKSEGIEHEGKWYTRHAFNNRWVLIDGEYFPRSETMQIMTSNGNIWVTTEQYETGVIDGEYFNCRRCGNDFSDDMREEYEGHNDYCHGCVEQMEGSTDVIRCYSHRVNISPYGTSARLNRDTSGIYGLFAPLTRKYRDRHYVGSNPHPKVKLDPQYPHLAIPKLFGTQASAPAKRYAGIELEMECSTSTNRAAKAVNDIVKRFAVLKSDSSIDDGFEMVSRPMALPTHQKIWDKFFAERPRGLSGYDTDTCGMHVHIGREGLSKSQIRKVAHFVSLPENDRFLRSIAGRNSDEWARKYPKSPKRWHDQIVSGHTDGRYSALNLENSGTIEFRIFKSTLKKASFLRNIEFCFAICEWMADGSRPHLHYQNAELFSAWVQQSPQRKIYPHLALFLAGRWPGSKVYGVVGNRKFSFETPEAPKVDAKEKPLITVPDVIPYDPDPEDDIEQPDEEEEEGDDDGSDDFDD